MAAPASFFLKIFEAERAALGNEGAEKLPNCLGGLQAGTGEQYLEILS
jgi:hypothetical protein